MIMYIFWYRLQIVQDLSFYLYIFIHAAQNFSEHSNFAFSLIIFGAFKFCCKIQNNHCSPPRTMLLVGKTNQILTQNLYGLRRWCQLVDKMFKFSQCCQDYGIGFKFMVIFIVESLCVLLLSVISTINNFIKSSRKRYFNTGLSQRHAKC